MNKINSEELRPAGYDALIKRFGLRVIPHWHHSQVAWTRTSRERREGGVVYQTYPAQHWPGDSLGDQLEFALKYDGVNLAILACIFDAMDVDEFTAYLKSRPTGQNVRRLWFFYEWMTGKALDLPDLKNGNYVDLIDPETYYISKPKTKIKRQRVIFNLLGESSFCPVVRRTTALQGFETKNLDQACKKLMKEYPPELLQRALAYSYLRETKSSFAIEHEEPNPSKVQRFVSLLEAAENTDFVGTMRLIELQNQIVDHRYKNSDYRSSQVYVGQTITPEYQKIHFVGAKPDDLRELMAGFTVAYMWEDFAVEAPVICAAIASYGFVFLHPFDDGNGRIHRFLIHNVLSRKFTPHGMIFPVSAAMLKDPKRYDESLEAFSKPLMQVVDYVLDENGRMTVTNDTKVWYRFMDLTAQAEALFEFIEYTIKHELVEELSFLLHYDRTKAAIKDVVDMPERKVDLFIKLCLQNKGKLSQAKRASQFAELTDEEVSRMEEAVWVGYEIGKAE